MTIQELIEYLKNDEEIGRNIPTSEVKIAIGVLKLKEAGIAEPCVDFYKLLRNFNGLSNNGCYILGINPENNFFQNLIDYNVKQKDNLTKNEIILGYDDAHWMVYNQTDKNYKIIDPDDGSEEATTKDLAEAVAFILHI